MTPTYLLDASVLIPLTSTEHVHHERVTRWVSGVGRFAICAVVEGALVRFAVRMGASAGEAQVVLTAIRSRPGYEFWSEAISYADTDLAHVRGHRQVTDAYLAGLASSRGGILATLDEALVGDCPQATLLVPR